MENPLNRAFKALLLSATTVFAAPLLAEIEAARPWLGVAIDQGDKGVLVTDVMTDTPAAAAGFVKGDQITAIDKIAVKAPADLIKAVQAQGVGSSVTVYFVREGKAAEKKVQLVARPDQLEVLRQKVVGRAVPPFDVKAIGGDANVKSADVKGKVVILEFWATWCPACRSTHQRLSDLAAARGKDGLIVLAVSDEDDATLKEYVSKVKPKFTVAQDTSGKMQADWMVSAIPLLAVVDREGMVVHATIGGGSYLEETIRAAESLLK